MLHSAILVPSLARRNCDKSLESVRFWQHDGLKGNVEEIKSGVSNSKCLAGRMSLKARSSGSHYKN